MQNLKELKREELKLFRALLVFQEMSLKEFAECNGFDVSDFSNAMTYNRRFTTIFSETIHSFIESTISHLPKAIENHTKLLEIIPTVQQMNDKLAAAQGAQGEENWEKAAKFGAELQNMREARHLGQRKLTISEPDIAAVARGEELGLPVFKASEEQGEDA